MKKTFIALITSFCIHGAQAQTSRQDTIRNYFQSTVESLYNTIIPIVDRIEISGGSEVSLELRRRWNEVVNHLKNNKEKMSDDVLNLLVSPSGQKIDMDRVKRFVNINDKDSITKIEINPDFIIDELKILGEKITNEMTRMAEQK